jgi:hypothetical protein
MCTGLEIAAIAGATAAGVGAKTAIDTRKDAKKAAANAAADTRKAEVDAINKSNTQIQMQRRALKDNSLFTGADSIGAAPQTLGVGG